LVNLGPDSHRYRSVYQLSSYSNLFKNQSLTIIFFNNLFLQDPLNLATEPANLARFTEAEVIHGRWAMLGVAGALGAEVLGQGDWYSAPLPLVQGGHAQYFGAEVPFDLGTLLAIEFIAMAGVELFRGAADAEKRIYPGGAFDPMGMSKGNLAELKLKEIKNGRLAMVAFLGFVGQYQANGKSPIEALSAHLSSPWAENFAMSKALPW
jgi:light-harvesting complex I chlorophyll a/b binding protein 1